MAMIGYQLGSCFLTDCALAYARKKFLCGIRVHSFALSPGPAIARPDFRYLSPGSFVRSPPGRKEWVCSQYLLARDPPRAFCGCRPFTFRPCLCIGHAPGPVREFSDLSGS